MASLAIEAAALSDPPRLQLERAGLRATEARIAVMQTLAQSEHPLSHSEVVETLSGRARCDPTTIYRTLTRLVAVGLAELVSRADGMDRYALLKGSHEGHTHPHFICSSCGTVSCLELKEAPHLRVERSWKRSVEGARLELHGHCAECLGQG